MVLFVINGPAEIICHFLDIKDVHHGVIIYIDSHREDVQGAPHGVVHVNLITVHP